MKEMECWCCDSFRGKTSVVDGYCIKLKKDICGLDRVCKNFILNKGFHTNRIIPDYCVNYSKNNGNK